MRLVMARRRLIATLTLVGLLISGVALAQLLAGQPVSGTISGTLGDQEFTWHTHLHDLGDEPEENTATYSDFMGTVDYTLQGHIDGAFIENALAISFIHFTGEPLECPCTFEGEVIYWTTSEMFNNLYSGEGEVIVEELVKLDDSSYSMRGSFSGTLEFYESMMQGPVAGSELPVQLTFDIERVDEVVIDLGF